MSTPDALQGIAFPVIPQWTEVATWFKEHVKTSHQEDFTDFLQKKLQPKTPTTLRPHDKGIEEAKKRYLLWKLSPHATHQEAVLELPAPEQPDEEHKH
ncbi:unnamed protein product [Lota lota]